MAPESDPGAPADDGDGEPVAPGNPVAGLPVVYVWPCNLPTYNLWCRVQTQWRTGAMGGKTGLDYTGVEFVMRQMGIKRQDRPEVFDQLQAMEVCAINAWALQQSQQA